MLKVFPQKYVFFSTAAGPAQCYYCLENDSATCSANQRVQTCATDASSLGTTHCGSAAGKYRDRRGNINFGVVRGCINCAGIIFSFKLSISKEKEGKSLLTVDKHPICRPWFM